MTFTSQILCNKQAQDRADFAYRAYLDWANNFLTISAFADYYDMDEDQARRLIEHGRQVHNEKQGAKQ